MTDTRLNLMPEGELDPVRIARALRDVLKGKFGCFVTQEKGRERPTYTWLHSEGRPGAPDVGDMRLNRAISEHFASWQAEGELTLAQVAKLERGKASIKVALAERTGMCLGGRG